MGFFDWLFGGGKQQNTIITVFSCMNSAAKQEIFKGKLPQIDAKELYLQKGEVCHYADNAKLLDEKIIKKYTSTGYGSSAPGIIFSDIRHSYRKSFTDVQEEIKQELFEGKLFITNQRIVFVSGKKSFDQKHRTLSSVKPYSNAIELQYNNKFFCLFVPDGYVANDVLRLLQ